MKICKECSGDGVKPAKTLTLSEIPGVCVAYRVLSWIACHVCRGSGLVAPKPKSKPS